MVTQKSVDKVIGDLDALVIEKFNKHAPAGLAVGVVYDGQLVYAKGFGMADIDKDKPVTPDTNFRIGSISKTFTTIGLMQLWEQGKFDLDDPVNPYLKTYKVLHDDPVAPPVTFRHLLTHTSGIGETRSIPDALKTLAGKLEIAAEPDEPVVPLGEYYHGRLRAEALPGMKWAYANHAYATLGQLIEDISGEKFEDYMVSHVLDPLGMTGSDYLLTERVNEQLAQGYNFKKGKFEKVPYQRIIVGAAGSIFSSVNQMARYAAMLMNGGQIDGTRIIHKETLDMMMTPQLSTDPRVYGIGLTFWLEKYGNHRVIEHGGGWPGFISSFRVAPDDKLGVIVFTNTSNMISDVLGKAIMRKLLGEADPAEKIPPKGVLQEPHRWPELTGFYGPLPGFLTNARFWSSFGGELEVYVNKQNQLAIRSLAGPLAKGIPIFRTDPKDPWFYQGFAKEGPLEGTQIDAVFGTDSQGSVNRVFLQQNDFYKRPYPQSLKLKANVLMGALAGLGVWFLSKSLCRKKRRG
ncbi:MAG: beta-lactamase family protein [Chloroflexi bacterium]|nr:beta-lactamase family protein [Chloroflexota bacterium]